MGNQYRSYILDLIPIEDVQKVDSERKKSQAINPFRAERRSGKVYPYVHKPDKVFTY